MTWSNDRGGSGVAAGTTSWTAANVPLQSGTNVISMTVVDTNGNSSTDTLAVDVSTFSYSLAEGATGSFFDLDVLIANPTTTPAPVTVTFFREDGSSVTQIMTLPATSRTTIHADAIAGLESQGGVSTVVTSTSAVPLVVERTMFWDASGYGSHGGTAVDGPRTRWLFAEGSEGFFNTFVLLANSGSAASNVTLTFLREGSTPFTRVVSVPPTSRVTVAANGIPELVGRSFSIVVDATAPIIAERAMYFGTARLFDGGHESTGVSEGATSWFLAEGATGPFFETFVLVGNPNPVAANVTFTFLTGTGQSVVRTKIVPANGRLTVNIEGEDPILANAAVSTTIASDQPVIAERAMYWPGPPSTWAEAHNSFGSTALSHAVGPGRRPRGHGPGVPDLHPAGEPGHDRRERPDHLPARQRDDGGQDLHGRPDLTLQRRRQQRRARAAERGLRGADRGHERGRHQRGAGHVFGRPGSDLDGRHERLGHSPAVA